MSGYLLGIKPVKSKPINLLGSVPHNKRDKQPAHLKAKTRQRWWGDKLLGKCFCCGRQLHYDDAQVGHIKAASKGGKWSPENCRLICQTCNSGMRNTNMKTYMKRYYPENYVKRFPKETKQARPTKKTPRKNPTYDPFGLNSIKMPKLRF